MTKLVFLHRRPLILSSGKVWIPIPYTKEIGREEGVIGSG
jgi:hypothetical protein